MRIIKLLNRFLPALLWATVIFILSSIPGKGFAKFQFFFYLPFADKLVHGVIYLILGVLTYRAFSPTERRFNYTLPLSIILCTAFGFTDELHQTFIPGRDMSMYDLLADSIGAIIGVSLWYIFRSKVKALKAEGGLPHE